MKKKVISWIMTAVMVISLMPVMALTAAAKTTPNGETVDTILFYAMDSSGNRVLVSQIPVSELVSDHQGGVVHNYSVLDRYVTTVHQEATGLTVPEFVEYAQGKSEDPELASAEMHYTGTDQIAFWEIDQTDFDDMDTYTYEELYGVNRYNFPELYKYWNYTTQDYGDPEEIMDREEVIQHLMDTAEPEQMVMSVTAFSQRYMNTDEKFEEKDYNMENYWDTEGLLDSERTIRLMIPMTEENLRNKESTASDTRYWVSRILLDMSSAPSFTSKGTVAEPTAVMTEDDQNYYVRFSCETEGATIYFNHNYQSVSYMPTCPYDGDVLEIDKKNFKNGTVTLTAHAVRDGYDDAGVVTLSLTSSGPENPEQPSTPSQPSQPSAPSSPSAPSGPSQPSAPQAQKPEIVCGEGGTADLSDDGTSLTIVPDEGYQIKDVEVNGNSRGSVSSLQELKTGDKVVITFEKSEESVPQEPSGPSEPSPQPEKKFSDVAEDAWYAAAVKHVTEKGYFQGTGETEFSPEMKMTRAMFVTVLGRRAGIDPSAYSGSDFKDVPEGQWYSASVKWASQNGIVSGIGGNLFDPDGSVTREQMAAIMYRYAEFCGLDMTADADRFRNFADRDQVSGYAEKAMVWATDRGIINGTEKGLEPGAEATRAQVAQIIINYAEKAA